LESSQETAQNDNRLLWDASVQSDGTITLINKAGQTLYYDNYTFRASSSPGTNKNLSYADGRLFCYLNHGSWSESLYPINDDNVPNNVIYNGVFYTTNTISQAMSITPYRLQLNEPAAPTGNGTFYRITNMPAGEATISLQVKKLWDLGSMGDLSLYEGLNIQMKLLADGEDSGITGYFNLRNGWSYTFESLPKYTNSGHEIQYTVKEINVPDGWHVQYSPVTSIQDSLTDYETFVTNVYHMTTELPSTGGIGPYGYMLLGALIMLGSLSLYCGQRRKEERGDC
jgi:LPXTG-motif cell wall-anchored protein